MFYVTDTIKATAAPTTGDPSPTNSWQWKRDGVPIENAVANSYITTEADIGSNLSVTQTATNIVGKASAESASLGPILSYNPITLFRTNEQGVWYDPSDMSTMFQDVVGTTPVTAVGQPVGLILDKSRGLVLGPELVTNGDFSNGTTGWTITAGAATVVASKLRLTRASNGGRFGQEESTVIGKTYRVSVDYSVGTAGPCIFRVTNNADQSADSRNFFVNLVPGVNTFYVQATATTTYFVIGSTSGDVGTYSDLDNISIRELPGNHATQTTTTSRPVLSARVNLLTKTEQFDDAAWVAARATISANNTTAPDGTLTADRITETTDLGSHRVFQLFSFQPNTTYTVSACFKKGTRRWTWILLQNDSTPATQIIQFFDLDTGLLGSSNTGVGGTQASRVSAAMTPLGDGWYRCSLTVAFGTAVTVGAFTGVYVGISNADNVNSYTGSTSDYNWIWGADLRAANTGVNLPAYQRVNTSTDYDTAGFPMYLRFDGVDDWLVTPSINFTSTDKMTVFAGSRYFGDALGILCETSTSIGTNNGSFSCGVNDFGTGRESIAGRGTITAGAQFIAPNGTTRVTTRQVDFAQTTSATEFSMRVDGVTQTPGSTTPTEAGSSNFGNYPLYIGRRGGAAFPFNGNLYSLIVRGAQSRDDQITQTEKFIASKIGIIL